MEMGKLQHARSGLLQGLNDYVTSLVHDHYLDLVWIFLSTIIINNAINQTKLLVDERCIMTIVEKYFIAKYHFIDIIFKL